MLLRRDYGEVERIAGEDRGALRTLMGLLFHEDELVKWRAVTAIGRLAASSPEAMRPKVFGLLWSLSEESGTVGWGSAQAIAEMYVNNPALAGEAIRPVLHYPDDEELARPANRNTPLLAGSIWATGRIADADPALAGEMGEALTGFLDDPDPRVRAVTAWALGRIGYGAAAGALEKLTGDGQAAEVYIDEELTRHTVGRYAADALARIRIKEN